MKTETIIQDYYGAKYFIEENKDEELIVFIVDDNKVFLKLLENALKRPSFSVYPFTTGEECLDFMRLKPDLVLLDYHLDGVNPYVKKGDVIYKLIKELSPETEIIMISSDNKFNLIAGLHLTQAKSLIYKDNTIISKLKGKIDSLLALKEDQKFFKKIRFIKKGILALLVMLFVFLLKYYKNH